MSSSQQSSGGPSGKSSGNQPHRLSVDQAGDGVSTAVVNVSPTGPLLGRVRVPGSKSLTNRALIVASMARGQSLLSGCLASEDTAVMIDSLRQIGINVEWTGSHQISVRNADPATTPRRSTDPPTDLYIANSGTSVRFLTAMLSAIGGHYQLSGVDRMHARPIGDLVDAIEPVMSGTIAAQSPGKCPPVRIQSDRWNDQPLRVAGGVSSQFLSGLMMAAGGAAKPRAIIIDGTLVSRPYVDMTAAVMRDFGVDVTGQTDRYVIESGQYTGTDYDVEPDASAASYFWAAAAITGGKVTVDGLSRAALQGDVGVVDVLEQMGCTVDNDSSSITVTGGDLRGVDVDMNAISDTVQTIAPVALFADSPTRIRGVAHNRFKETDRIGDLANELRKFGSRIDEHEDGLTIHPIDSNNTGPNNTNRDRVSIETYHDHRMAMGMSLVGLRRENVWITNPSCTGKTYPEYFADLEHLAGRAWHWSTTEAVRSSASI